jgi:hypothetical protein
VPEVLAVLGLEISDLFPSAHAHRRPDRRPDARRRRAPARRGESARVAAALDRTLDAFAAAGLEWRCAPSPGTWRAECPVCHDPRRSVWIIDHEREPGREGDDLLAFCATGCDPDDIAAALVKRCAP